MLGFKLECVDKRYVEVLSSTSEVLMKILYTVSKQYINSMKGF